MFNYSGNKNFESWLGWFREADLNIGEAASTGSFNNCAGGANAGCQSRRTPPTWSSSTIRSSRFLACVRTTLHSLHNNTPSATGAAAGLASSAASNVGVWVPKSANSDSSQHWKPDWRCEKADSISSMNSNTNSARWHLVSQLGTCWAQYPWTSTSMPGPRVTGWATRCMRTSGSLGFAVGLDYASGDGNGNCNAPGQYRHAARPAIHLRISIPRITSTWAIWM